MSTSGGGSRPGSGLLVTPAASIAGSHRASARGQVNAGERTPNWARSSPAAMTAYQIARYGLSHNMSGHERPVLIMSLQQMLRQSLPAHVRTAVRRQLAALGVDKSQMPRGPSPSRRHE